ncbi:ABC transporter ATP-binding protein [Bacillus marinisedimentorum]|uniref:ABC transporter ATP-binding protein n=1 Tax=Bacillus marinisedimentorum TaxID=1821260 RepID=UPI00087310F8|nr:ABC transporter ATP-binding protein [Bacillus marinisedimentorum]
MSVIDIKKLTKFYGKNRGIEDVTFSVEEGEIFGFIGPNGAGKSTTIRTLLNFIYPSEGSASILGLDIVKESKEIRKQIGYLPSEVHYYDDMKAIELLKYSAGFYGGDHTNKIIELAERLDLDLNRKIEDLSFGNKKKIGIVQALLHDPKLLILDEPTSGLDPLMQNIFFDLLREMRANGTTIFFSSHYLGEVQKLCDRVAIIKEGKLIKVESIEDLRKNQFKNVSILFDDDRDYDPGLEGIIQKEKIAHGVKFLYSGNTHLLLERLQNVPFRDILIEEPSLEEVFMHYYEKDQ